MPQNQSPFTGPGVSPHLLKTGWSDVIQTWGLNGEEQKKLVGFAAGSPSAVRPSQEARERMRLVCEASHFLSLIVADKGDQARWVRSPNNAEAFRQRSPLDVMMQGGVTALEATRDYLQQRAGGTGVSPYERNRARNGLDRVSNKARPVKPPGAR